MEKTKSTCCFCGKEIEGWGNSPWPIKDASLKCCNACDYKYVIPARLSALKKNVK